VYSTAAKRLVNLEEKVDFYKKTRKYRTVNVTEKESIAE